MFTVLVGLEGSEDFFSEGNFASRMLSSPRNIPVCWSQPGSTAPNFLHLMRLSQVGRTRGTRPCEDAMRRETAAETSAM